MRMNTDVGRNALHGDRGALDRLRQRVEAVDRRASRDNPDRRLCREGATALHGAAARRHDLSVLVDHQNHSARRQEVSMLDHVDAILLDDAHGRHACTAASQHGAESEDDELGHHHFFPLLVFFLSADLALPLGSSSVRHRGVGRPAPCAVGAECGREAPEIGGAAHGETRTYAATVTPASLRSGNPRRRDGKYFPRFSPRLTRCHVSTDTPLWAALAR